MSGSQNNKTDIIFSIYKDVRTVFKFKDVTLLVGEENFGSLNQKLNYHVKTGKLQNPRKGIYTKSGYNQKCIDLLESLNNKGLLHGMGELMDTEMKTFVKTKLLPETISLMRFYKEFPL